MQQHILMVEDDEDLGQILFQFLEAEGYKVDWLKDGNEVIHFQSQFTPDIILMDIQLPGPDGVNLTNKIREKSDVPIIMVTSKSDELSRLKGLQTGVDDYVCKPFSAPELILRIKAVLKRASYALKSTTNKPYVNINHNNLTLEFNDKIEKLTLIEANLLDLLLSTPNRIYSRSQLLNLAYNNDRNTTGRTIDSHIKNVRKKLEKIGLTKMSIESVYGEGYRYINSN